MVSYILPLKEMVSSVGTCQIISVSVNGLLQIICTVTQSPHFISPETNCYSSEDAGLARFDWNTGFWLSTWNDNNWLTSNNVADVIVSNNIMAILNGNTLQTYNTLNGVFEQTYNLQDFGMVNDGENLVVWPSIGVRLSKRNYPDK